LQSKLSGTNCRLSILRRPPSPVAIRQEIDRGGLILPMDVWYIILNMVQRAPAFGFYFGWYFTR
jgi:hypothetical protein